MSGAEHLSGTKFFCFFKNLIGLLFGLFIEGLENFFWSGPFTSGHKRPLKERASKGLKNRVKMEKIRNRVFKGFFDRFLIFLNARLDSGRKIDIIKCPYFFFIGQIRPDPVLPGPLFSISDPFSFAFLTRFHPFPRGLAGCVRMTEIRASIWYQACPGIFRTLGAILKTKTAIFSGFVAIFSCKKATKPLKIALFVLRIAPKLRIIPEQDWLHFEDLFFYFPTHPANPRGNG